MFQLKVFKCKYCKTRFVVMLTENNSMLPVEINNGETFGEDIIFDAQRHRSHLLNCKGRQEDWSTLKKHYMKFSHKTIIEVNE